MTNKKITGLIAATSASATDLLVLVTALATTPVTKKITLNTFLSNLPSSASIVFGGDTNLYWGGANTLKTDDSLVVALNTLINGNLYLYTAAAPIYFGNSAGVYDTNIYRSSASSLKTNGSFGVLTGGSIVIAGLAGGGKRAIYVDNSGNIVV
jgi:hypothetical protein